MDVITMTQILKQEIKVALKKYSNAERELMIALNALRRGNDTCDCEIKKDELREIIYLVSNSDVNYTCCYCCVCGGMVIE